MFDLVVSLSRSGVVLWSRRGSGVIDLNSRSSGINERRGSGRCWGRGEIIGMFSRPWWRLFSHRIMPNIHNNMLLRPMPIISIADFRFLPAKLKIWAISCFNVQCLAKICFYFRCPPDILTLVDLHKNLVNVLLRVVFCL